MPDCMAATVTVPTWALTHPGIVQAPANETETVPDGTTRLVYIDAPPADDPGCDTVVLTCSDGQPAIRLADLAALAEIGPLTLGRIRAGLGVPAVSVAAWAAAQAPSASAHELW